jgi:hypothetical protein
MWVYNIVFKLITNDNISMIVVHLESICKQSELQYIWTFFKYTIFHARFASL